MVLARVMSVVSDTPVSRLQTIAAVTRFALYTENATDRLQMNAVCRERRQPRKMAYGLLAPSTTTPPRRRKTRQQPINTYDGKTFYVSLPTGRGCRLKTNTETDSFNEKRCRYAQRRRRFRRRGRRRVRPLTDDSRDERTDDGKRRGRDRFARLIATASPSETRGGPIADLFIDGKPRNRRVYAVRQTTTQTEKNRVRSRPIGSYSPKTELVERRNVVDSTATTTGTCRDVAAVGTRTVACVQTTRGRTGETVDGVCTASTRTEVETIKWRKPTP